MNEKGLIEQVLRIINKNYSNIYVVDIAYDKVFKFEFNITNQLVIKDSITYTDFIDVASKFVHPEELSKYFDAISLNKLESESQKGNSETKVTYRKLCETGEYRWFVNIIDYLPFEGRKLIFMMSEDVNERLTSSEENNLKLETEVVNYKNRLNSETESISDAIYQINNLLENGASTNNVIKMRDTREYINSIFNKVSSDHPELNQALLNKMVSSNNYKKPTILIVDDSSIIRNSLKRIFSNEYDILMAKDGNEAIDAITNNVLNGTMLDSSVNIVAVLLDLVMPGADGFVVLEFMKKFNLFSRIPVAIISGDETRETRKRVYQYEIVDMLEKPFNTENIRRRISKIITLYLSSNNLQSIVEVQSQELKSVEDTKSLENIGIIINQIVNNIMNNENSNRLKRMVKVLATNLANKYPKYNLNMRYIDYIVSTCPLYNIGAIAMNDNIVITSKTIKEEIDYGLSIAKNYINDAEELKVAENIIKYSCEMYNGSGYPNGVAGDNIPVEAQLTNILVRLSQNKGKNMASAIKNLVEKESAKYNPDVIDVLNDSKKELKDLT